MKRFLVDRVLMRARVCVLICISGTTQKSEVLILSVHRLATTRNISKAPMFKSFSHISPPSLQLMGIISAGLSHIFRQNVQVSIQQTNQSIDNAPVALRTIFVVDAQLQFLSESDVR